MRVVFIASSLDSGGAEHQLRLLAAGLAAHGHEVTVVALRGGGRLHPAFVESALDVKVVASSRSEAPLLPVRLARLLRSLRPDVIHGYLPVPNCVAVLARLVAPRARVVMGVRGVSPERQGHSRRVRWVYGLEALASRLASAVIANSDSARDWTLSRGFPAERVHVVPNGIDLGRFAFDEEGRRRLRAAWSVAEEDVLVGRVGGLRPIKDYPTFLRAAARLAAAAPRARFACVGSGSPEMERHLRELADSLGLEDRLRWLGQRDDVPAVLSALDVLVSSSVAESFPNVVVEAMACGVPCVVTAVGESARLVGDTGAVVSPGQPEAMAEAIASVVDRLGLEGQALRDEVRSRVAGFDVAAMVTATEALLRRL